MDLPKDVEALLNKELQKAAEQGPPKAWVCSACGAECAHALHEDGVIGGHLSPQEHLWICPKTKELAHLSPKAE